MIEAFVEALHLSTLGFSGAPPGAVGRQAYHLVVLFKLYISGYLNWLQSTWWLEGVAGGNEMA